MQDVAGLGEPVPGTTVLTMLVMLVGFVEVEPDGGGMMKQKSAQ